MNAQEHYDEGERLLDKAVHPTTVSMRDVYIKLAEVHFRAAQVGLALLQANTQRWNSTG